MYLPKHFEMPEGELFDFIATWSFGTLISTQSGSLGADYLPFLVDPAERCLYCHLAKTNPQAGRLKDADDLLVSFTGPHGYVSPRWYQTSGLVPTWNYSAVQVQGRALPVSDPERKRTIVQALSQKHEAGSAHPWQLSEVPEAVLSTMLHAIVCFRIEIISLQGKAKLSQNRAPADQAAVMSGLQSLEGGRGRELAEYMNVRLSIAPAGKDI
jgi:transcriptional regulator